MDSTIMQRVAQMEEEYRRSMSRIDEASVGMKKTGATTLHVSTITFLCETSAHDIDVSKIIPRFDKEADMAPFFVRGNAVIAKPVGKTLNTKGKIKESFYNQVSLFYKDDVSKKNIKVFKNGKLHITGEKDVRENVLIASDVCRILERIFDREPSSVQIVDFNIQMINTNFRMSHGFILKAFKETVARLPDVPRATYDPETYPGLNIKLKLANEAQVTVLVFNTGNVIVTGLRNFEGLAEAYVRFVEFVDANIEAFKRQNYESGVKVH